MVVVQSQSGSLRGLKALVAVLGVLVVLGTAVVAGVVIKRFFAPAAALPDMAAAPARQAGAATLPPGSRILGLAGAGDTFAIWTSGPAGAQVYLLDPATGALRLAVQALTPAAPGN